MLCLCCCCGNEPIYITICTLQLVYEEDLGEACGNNFKTDFMVEGGTAYSEYYSRAPPRMCVCVCLCVRKRETLLSHTGGTTRGARRMLCLKEVTGR
jgi:hypothetical protein